MNANVGDYGTADQFHSMRQNIVHCQEHTGISRMWEQVLKCREEFSMNVCSGFLRVPQSEKLRNKL